MMAYFSNGTEGMLLDELCFRCVHGMDEKGENRQAQPCAAWQLQAMWNYEQHETDPDAGQDMTIQNGIRQPFGLRSREGRVKKMALDMLLPQTKDRLCAMYLAAPVENSCGPEPTGGRPNAEAILEACRRFWQGETTRQPTYSDLFDALSQEVAGHKADIDLLRRAITLLANAETGLSESLLDRIALFFTEEAVIPYLCEGDEPPDPRTGG